MNQQMHLTLDYYQNCICNIRIRNGNVTFSNPANLNSAEKQLHQFQNLKIHAHDAKKHEYLMSEFHTK